MWRVFLAATLAFAVLTVGLALYLGFGDPGGEVPEVDPLSTSIDDGESHVGRRRAASRGENGSFDPDPKYPADREPLLKSRQLAEKALYEGPVIAGVVLDGRTGKAPESRSGFRDRPAFYVWELASPGAAPQLLRIPTMRYEDGAFTIPIASLKPQPLGGDARYAITCDTHRYVLAFVEDLTLSPDQGVDGIRFELEERGRLRLSGDGYRGNGLETFRIECSCHTRPVAEKYWSTIWGGAADRETLSPLIRRTSRPGAALRDSDGKLDHTLSLDPGVWQVDISLCDDEKSFHVSVASGRTTELVVNRGDLGHTFTILGSVTDGDGNPQPGVKLRFDGRGDLDGFVEPARYRTDEKGEFAPLALVPGLWEITAWSKAGESLSFPCVHIPDRPPDPYRLELVVREGTVSGRLFDRIAGRPFGDDYTRWFLLVRDVDTGKVVAERFHHFGGAFRIPCVPPGRLALEVRARGFADTVTEPFRHEGTGDVDLGDVPVERFDGLGSAIISIVDGEGAPFKGRVSLEVFRPVGREGAYEKLSGGEDGYGWEYLGENRFRFDRLPAQEVTFSVVPAGRHRNADPIRPVRRNVTIEAGGTVQVSVTMPPSS